MAPHPQRLTVTRRTWALAEPFAAAQGVKTLVDVVVAEISDGDSRGSAEAVPLQRYGESIESVVAALHLMKSAVVSGLDRETLQRAMPPGAARNALDCAFWAIEAHRAYASVAELAGVGTVKPVMTAFVIGLDTPEKMAGVAANNCSWQLLKLKLAAAAVGAGDVLIHRRISPSPSANNQTAI